MIYVKDFETGKRVIVDRYPELVNSQFKSDNSGWTNFAIKVDNKYLFRFPRNDEAYKAVNKEYKILKILNKKLPINIKVPKYIYSSLNDDYPFVGYAMIQGDFLTEDVFNSLDESKKDNILNNMAIFLNVLHSVDYKELGLEPVNSIEWYKDLFDRVQKICFKYFVHNLKEKTIQLFNIFFNDESMHNYEPTLVHGDLSEDHIIITSDGVGIIDFGDLMVFDPAYDLIWAYICDVDFYNKLFKKYTGHKDNYFEHRIRDFHIIRPPYDGIIYADEIHDNDMINEQIKKLTQIFDKRGE